MSEIEKLFFDPILTEDFRDVVAAAKDELSALRTALEEAKEDKQLLDWLERTECAFSRPFPPDNLWWIFFEDDGRDVSGSSLRTAIRAARANSEKEAHE